MSALERSELLRLLPRPLPEGREATLVRFEVMDELGMRTCEVADVHELVDDPLRVVAGEDDC